MKPTEQDFAVAIAYLDRCNPPEDLKKNVDTVIDFLSAHKLELGIAALERQLKAKKSEFAKIGAALSADRSKKAQGSQANRRHDQRNAILAVLDSFPEGLPLRDIVELLPGSKEKNVYQNLMNYNARDLVIKTGKLFKKRVA